MANYVWFPVTGSGQTSADPYVWNAGTFAFSTGADWVNIDQIQNPYLTGVVPGSGPGDAAFLVAGSASTFLLQLLYQPNPAAGKPFIQFGPGSTTFFPVDVQLASGSVTLATLGLGQPASFVSSTYPILEIQGARLTVTGNVLDAFSETFPQPFGTQSAAAGGTIDLSASAVLDVGGTVGTLGATPDILIDFKDTTASVLQLDGVSSTNSGAFAGQVLNFGANNVIDLTSVPLAAAPAISYNTVTQTLTLSSGVTTYATLNIAGSYTTGSFTLRADGGTGTEIVTCFAAGTRILTDRGERPVEVLRAGDRVVRAAGRGTEAVAWIGIRHVACDRHAHPERVRPIRVAGDAFGPAQPARDLFLSPDHAIYADGVLIPVKCLVNDTSIAPTRAASVTYYHIELPQHDVVLAEGLAVESLLPSEDRSSFGNAERGPIALHPDFHALLWEAEGFAPLQIEGPVVDAVRARLAERARTILARAA